MTPAHPDPPPAHPGADRRAARSTTPLLVAVIALLCVAPVFAR
ncbi:hypothetical protein [Saccharothrix xinjiangensis]